MTDTETKAPAAPAAVEIDNLSKNYRSRGDGEKRALDAVSLRIPKGSMFGLLGPNGAGKSTLINIMAGLVNKSSGRVAIAGHDIDTDSRMARFSIGVVPQELNLDPFFTPRELLDVQAGMYGVAPSDRRTDDILDAVGLRDKSRAYARSLSGGMRRRLLIAKALVHSPPILVLDEPTAGVDIELRQQLWSYVKQLNEAGTTILLTTHYLEEAQSLCDRIAIINSGRIVADAPTHELLRRLDSKTVCFTVAERLDTVPEPLAAFGAELSDDAAGAPCVTIRYQPSRVVMADILNAASRAGLTIKDLRTTETDLEDIFLQLTSKRHAA